MYTRRVYMKPKELAERIGVSVKTLQKWDRQGKLPAKR
ncbi:MerR family DNA-binding transcriptional regulator, partial [Lentilactobacillus sp. G22-6]